MEDLFVKSKKTGIIGDLETGNPVDEVSDAVHSEGPLAVGVTL